MSLEYAFLIGVPMLLVSINNFKNDLTFLSRTGAMYTGFENMALEYPLFF